MTIYFPYKKGNLKSLKNYMDKWVKVRNKIYKRINFNVNINT